MTEMIRMAAAQLLGCDYEDVDCLTYDVYGLKIFSDGSQEYAIGTDEEADAAVREYIKESVWAFRASFILDHAKIEYSSQIENQIKQMQEKLCENANELLLALIKDFDGFVDDAVSADGRGSFLASYDGEEQDVKIGDEWFYAYRIN